MALQGNEHFKVFVNKLADHGEVLMKNYVNAPEDKLVSFQAHVQQNAGLIEAIIEAPKKLSNNTL